MHAARAPGANIISHNPPPPPKRKEGRSQMYPHVPYARLMTGDATDDWTRSKTSMLHWIPKIHVIRLLIIMNIFFHIKVLFPRMKTYLPTCSTWPSADSACGVLTSGLRAELILCFCVTCPSAPVCRWTLNTAHFFFHIFPVCELARAVQPVNKKCWIILFMRRD